MKKLLSLVAAFVIASTSAIAVVNPSQADTGYRYWSYWMFNDGQWEMASEGAGTTAALDGQLQGWRFITSGVEASTDLAPRTEATFEEICGDVEPVVGVERVAFVIDYGDASDYDSEVEIPATTPQCVTVESGSPSTLVLAQVAQVREVSGFVCAINELPAVGCGESVETTTPELMTTTSAPVEENQETDWLATIITTGLGLVVLVMAFRRMQWQKAQKLQALADEKVHEKTDE